MLILATVLATALLSTGALYAYVDQGQGPVEGDEVLLEDLDMGEYWYGAEVDKSELKGKVVLVEMWGS